MTATCETCRFWGRPPAVGAKAPCRIKSPIMTLPGQAPWPMTWGDETCGEHQPRAAAPAPEADTGALRAALAECCGMLFALAQQIEDERRKLRGDWTDGQVERISETAARARAALSTTPPRPAMDSETRQVLGDMIAAAHEAYEAYGDLNTDGMGDIEYHTLGDALDAARAHLAAHGGGDE